jgi:hypothetical protein
MNVTQLGYIIIFAGLFLIIFGTFMILGSKIPFLGKLPGDIIINKQNTRILIPVTTSIIISIILSALVNLIFIKH